MRLDVRVALGVLAAVAIGAGTANAQVSDDIVRIGVLNDQSNVYADLGGQGSVIAARMAIDDFGGKVLGKPIDMLVADHQSKADVGASIARQWFNSDKVDLAIGFDNSSVALAVEQVAFQKIALPLPAPLAPLRSPERPAHLTKQRGCTTPMP